MQSKLTLSQWVFICVVILIFVFLIVKVSTINKENQLLYSAIQKSTDDRIELSNEKIKSLINQNDLQEIKIKDLQKGIEILNTKKVEIKTIYKKKEEIIKVYDEKELTNYWKNEF